MASLSLKHGVDNITQFTHTHPFNGPLSRTTRVGRYQKGKTNQKPKTKTSSITQFNRMETIHQFHKIPVKHAIVHITLKITYHLIC